MDKRVVNGSQRLRDTSTAPRPYIALDIARTTAACTAVASLVGRRCTLSAASAMEAATMSLADRNVGTARNTAVDAITAAAFAAATARLSERAAHLALLTVAGPRAAAALSTAGPVGEKAALTVLRDAGFAVTSPEDPTLTHLGDDAVIISFRALLDAQALMSWVADGALRRSVAAAYDSVTTVEGSIDDTVGAITLAGFDGEKLCWAAITFETHNHIRLVWHQSNKLSRTFPNRRPADLFGWGWQGLRISLRQYDPSRGAFSTYACTRISGSIRDGVRSESPIPKRLTTYVRKVAKAEEDLTQALGRVPALAELAEHLGERLDQLHVMARLAPAASIEELSTMSGERGGLAWLSEDGDPADSAVSAACTDAIAAAMASLPDEERTAARLLLYEGYSVLEARELTGATARQLRQRCGRAKEHLARELDGWQDERVEATV